MYDMQAISYQCNGCDKTFSNNSDHMLHLTTHSGEKSYQCSICENINKISYSLLHD